MNSTTNRINWEDKPKLSHKWLSFVFIVLGGYFFFLAYTNASIAYKKYATVFNSGINMQALSNDLVNLKISPLDSLALNQKKLDLLYNLSLGQVEISYPEINSNKKNPLLTPHSDNLGNFYRVKIVFFGDMYEQLYFLAKLNILRGFVMVDSMNANQRNIIIKARLYGQ